MASLLVTGAAGFIGSNFVHYWHERHPGDRIVALDALTYAGNVANLSSLEHDPLYRFVHADIAGRDVVEGLLAEEGIDTIVHFAAESHVDRSIAGPEAFMRVNANGTQALLEAARNVWCDDGGAWRPHRFHHVSTDEVFGTLGPDDAPFTESSVYAPNSPYAASKAAADHIVRAYHHTYGLNVTTSNCSNNYGPYQFPEKLVPLLIVNMLEGRPLPIYGEGLNRRDWLHVRDHCAGIEAVLHKGESGEVYVIGGNNERTNIEIVTKLCTLVDDAFSSSQSLRGRFPSAPAAQGEATESLITFVKDRAGHDFRYAVDASRIERDLQFRPSVEFDAGLASTLGWYLENEPWWRAVMDGSYRAWIMDQYGARSADAQTN